MYGLSAIVAADGIRLCRIAPRRSPLMRLTWRYRPRVSLHRRSRQLRRRLEGQLPKESPAVGAAARALRVKAIPDALDRAGLALAMRQIASDAERPGATLDESICGVAVLQWREGLLGLAGRLEGEQGSAALDFREITRARRRPTNGLGQPRRARAHAGAPEAMRLIAEQLSLWHRWGRPVEMEPGCVVWRCERCGALATTDGPAARPR
ncbi:MAG: hypothetical protein JOZ07_14175 [Solirubrobacterales bacterium]|nr:hypothetical protein [Solirubrobacterales bacterium]